MAEEEPEDEGSEASVDASALAELTLCENLAQVSGWAARWGANGAGADGAVLWAPDALHPLFLCIAAVGAGTEKMLRRSAPKDGDILEQLMTDREPLLLDRRTLLTSTDPFLKGIPTDVEACVAVPLEAEGLVIGILNLLFKQAPDAEAALSGASGFLQFGTPALARALRTERKTVGMMHAIERLTNLFDLSKAFGSTIDLGELTDIIVKKSVDLLNAEVASLWILQEGNVSLAGTAINENYEVDPKPDAVGMAVVADVVVEQQTVLRNRLEEDDPIRVGDAPYVVKSILAAPFLEDERPVGALIVTNKRGRNPEFTAADEELLADLARQAVRALHNARQYEAEKKVEELDALLTVSREITSTLDLDKVMATIVNGSAALINYDRCALAIQQRGKLVLGAVSGMATLNRSDESVQRTEALLEWVFGAGNDVAVTQQEDGSMLTDRPETEEKFRSFFAESGMRSFYGVLLKDDEGKLGVLGFESQEPFVFDENTRDMLQILVNQATVAVRNAQLYQQVPLVGFLKPLAEGQRKLALVPMQRLLTWAGVIAAVLVLGLVIPWKVRVDGPAHVLPGHRIPVTAAVSGTIQSVEKHEGDAVKAGDVVAVLDDAAYQSALAEARSALSIAESAASRYRAEGNAAGFGKASSERAELAAKLALAERNLEETRLKAPAAGVLLTPRLEERVGQFVPAGGEVATLADIRTVVAEVAIPENDASLLSAGSPVALKINSYPTRIFRGQVTRIGAQLHENGEERYVLAQTEFENPELLLKPGMSGRGKITVGTRRLLTAFLRRPARYFWTKLWPMLP